MMRHPECLKWHQRSEAVLAGGPATLSKMASRYPVPIAPSVLVRGDGPYVWCADSEKYIDVVSALGPCLLGHDDCAISLAVMEQVSAIACSTLSTPLETEVAEILCSLIPGAEMCRFASNGADVTNAAVKLARHVTGKRHAIFCGYHGGFGDYLITTDKHGGLLPSLSNFNHQVPWRDFEALNRILEGIPTIPAKEDLAVLMLEVPPEAQGVTKEDTAATIRRYADIAHSLGALFILDEVVTWGRYGLSGAQGYYGVEADLITASKALGNGYPIAAVLGPRDLMRAFEGGSCFLSTTFGGSPIGLAAAKATIKELQQRDVLTQMWERGEAVRSHMTECFALFEIPATVRGNGARWVVDFHGDDAVASSDELRTLWLQELARRGVLAGVPWLPMTSWTETVARELCAAIEQTCGVIAEVLQGKRGMQEALEVAIISDVFSRYKAPKQNW